MDEITHVYVPKWAAVLYGTLAVILIPWIFNLAQSLPTRHLAWHWDAVWVGFDIIMFVAMAITLVFMIRRVVWVAISATALATLFIVDAWFDILTAKPGSEQRAAFIFGALEITLAALTYRLVYHVVHYSTPDKKIKLVAKRKHSTLHAGE